MSFRVDSQYVVLYKEEMESVSLKKTIGIYKTEMVSGSAHFTHILGVLRNNSDIAISWEEGHCKQVIRANKCVLEACSPEFTKLYECGQPAQSNCSPIMKLNDLECKFSDLHILIDFVYTGKVMLTLENISTILYLAGYFKMQTLLQVCETYLTDIVNTDTCILIFLVLCKNDTAVKIDRDLTSLKKDLVEFIRSNVCSLVQSHQIYMFSTEDILLLQQYQCLSEMVDIDTACRFANRILSRVQDAAATNVARIVVTSLLSNVDNMSLHNNLLLQTYLRALNGTARKCFGKDIFNDSIKSLQHLVQTNGLKNDMASTALHNTELVYVKSNVKKAPKSAVSKDRYQLTASAGVKKVPNKQMDNSTTMLAHNNASVKQIDVGTNTPIENRRTTKITDPTIFPKFSAAASIGEAVMFSTETGKMTGIPGNSTATSGIAYKNVSAHEMIDENEFKSNQDITKNKQTDFIEKTTDVPADVRLVNMGYLADIKTEPDDHWTHKPDWSISPFQLTSQNYPEKHGNCTNPLNVKKKELEEALSCDNRKAENRPFENEVHTEIKVENVDDDSPIEQIVVGAAYQTPKHFVPRLKENNDVNDSKALSNTVYTKVAESSSERSTWTMKRKKMQYTNESFKKGKTDMEDVRKVRFDRSHNSDDHDNIEADEHYRTSTETKGAAGIASVNAVKQETFDENVIRSCQDLSTDNQFGLRIETADVPVDVRLANMGYLADIKTEPDDYWNQKADICISPLLQNSENFPEVHDSCIEHLNMEKKEWENLFSHEKGKARNNTVKNKVHTGLKNEKVNVDQIMLHIRNRAQDHSGNYMQNVEEPCDRSYRNYLAKNVCTQISERSTGLRCVCYEKGETECKDEHFRKKWIGFGCKRADQSNDNSEKARPCKKIRIMPRCRIKAMKR